MGLKLSCHYWNISRHKDPKCPVAETFPVQRALGGAAVLQAGGCRDPEDLNVSHGVNFTLPIVSFILLKQHIRKLA